MLLAPPLKQGTLAEYAVLPSAAVVRKPDELDFATAAAIPLSGAVAVAAVDAIDPQPGEAVLIVGASGGVGSYAVQVAAGRGAIVIATGLPEEEDRLRDLGAGHVVDYRENLAEQVRRAYLGGVQGLIDLVSYSPDALAEHASLLEEGGRVASTAGAADGEALEAQKLTGSNILATHTAAVVGPLVEKAAQGALAVDVEQVLPLAAATAGLQDLAAGKGKGQTVVRVVEEARR